MRSDLGEAKAIAREACIKVGNGEQSSLELTERDWLCFARAVEYLAPTGVHQDTACKEFAEALAILGGKASITEACREWIKRNAITLPKITVADAVKKFKGENECEKSQLRRKALLWSAAHLEESFGTSYVDSLTPDLVSRDLAGLNLAERTKKNHRDSIGFFSRWLVLRGYLAKGTDWLEHVQDYTAKKLGEIQIYTPDELKKLLSKADKRFVLFIAIGAFAGLRHAEIARLNWSEVELHDKAGESFIEVRADKAKTQTRRLVPVADNLRAWLMTHRKSSGKVCPFANTTKQLLKSASDAGVEWRRNGLRHSAISYPDYQVPVLIDCYCAHAYS